jgi:iron complex outermembrane receptor protein
LGNLRAPDYWLGNTGQQEFNLNAIAFWSKKAWTHEIIASTFNQKMAVLRAGHVGSLSDVDLAIASDTPRNNPNFFTYRIDRPYQAVQHNTLKYKAIWRISDLWRLSLQHYVQYNHRQEFDVVRKTGAAAEKPQVTFTLLHNTSDIMLEHFPIRHWQGGVGAQVVHAFNQVGRGGFIPDYQSFGGSLWWHERWRRHPSPWEFEFGIRADYRQTAAQTSGSLQNLDTSVHFATASANVGWIYHINPNLRLAFNSGLVMRPPHVNELFAKGVDFLLANYRRGQPDMVNEKAWNNTLTLTYQRKNTLLTLSVFRNTIYDFIYLNPTGQKVLTIRGSFPEYAHTQTQRAVLQGFEGQFEFPVIRQLLLETNASILRAFRLTTENPSQPGAHAWLPLMPADRFQYGLRWHLKAAGMPAENAGNKQNLTLRVFASTTLRQSRLPLEGLLKPAPAGFTTLNADATCFLPFGKKQLELGLLMRNIGNVRYREYLNFFRFYADEPGFNLGVRLKVILNNSL